MKYVLTVLLSYGVVFVYAVFFLLTHYSWIPLALLVLLILYRYADSGVVWLYAIAAGILMDVHFQYLGPYVFLLCSSVIIVRWLHTLIAPRRSLLNMLVQSGVLSVWYTTVLYVLSASTIGFRAYVMQQHAFVVVVQRSLLTWALLFIILILIHGSVVLISNARR